MLKVVSLPISKPSESDEIVKEYASNIKMMADNGEIKSFTAVMELNDGTYHSLQTRDETPHKTGGVLLEMAIRRVVSDR